MNKLILIAFTITLVCSCSRENSLKKYSMKIYKYRISHYVFNKSPGTLKKDTVRYILEAKNDTIAFAKGFEIWAKDAKNELSLSMKDSSTMRTRFIIRDPKGRNLEKKLPRKIVDSIMRMAFTLY